jgi:hypothetical protein
MELSSVPRNKLEQGCDLRNAVVRARMHRQRGRALDAAVEGGAIHMPHLRLDSDLARRWFPLTAIVRRATALAVPGAFRG